MDTAEIRELYRLTKTGNQGAALELASILDRVRREVSRGSLVDFTRYTFTSYRTNWHHREIAAALDRVARGTCKRLMIFVPPRHGKSELGSRRFPAFLLGRNPNQLVIAASYSADLARSMNRDTQRVIDSPRYHELFPETTLSGSNVRSDSRGNYLRNADEFEVVGFRGGYKSVGVGGGITGRGFDIGIIDDPVKRRAEAESKVFREALKDWYLSDFYSRRQGSHAAIVLIMTRWHEDDLAGWLLAQQEEGVGDEWEVLWFPAIAEADNPFRVPTLDVDPRSPGEALDPGLFDADELLATMAKNSRDAASLYQGRPSSASGGLFLREWVQEATIVDGGARVRLASDGREYALSSATRFLTVDLAVSKKTSADHTAIGAWAIVGDRQLVLLDVDCRRLGGHEHLPAVDSMLKKWNASTAWIESTAFQLALVDQARAAGLPVRALVAESDKFSRAVAATPIFEERRIHLCGGAWRDKYEAELFGFPNAAFDDQVDMTSYATQVATKLTRSKALGILSLPDGGRRYDSSVTIEKGWSE